MARSLGRPRRDRPSSVSCSPDPRATLALPSGRPTIGLTLALVTSDTRDSDEARPNSGQPKHRFGRMHTHRARQRRPSSRWMEVGRCVGSLVLQQPSQRWLRSRPSRRARRRHTASLPRARRPVLAFRTSARTMCRRPITMVAPPGSPRVGTRTWEIPAHRIAARPLAARLRGRPAATGRGPAWAPPPVLGGDARTQQALSLLGGRRDSPLTACSIKVTTRTGGMSCSPASRAKRPCRDDEATTERLPHSPSNTTLLLPTQPEGPRARSSLMLSGGGCCVITRGALGDDSILRSGSGDSQRDCSAAAYLTPRRAPFDAGRASAGCGSP